MKKLTLVQKICFGALILSLVVLGAQLISPTLSRYAQKIPIIYEGEEELDYTLNGVFIAHNQEELFSAVNQGYSYVQLSKTIRNPLIVTQDVRSLNTDLIIDLNGIEIQRNGHEPILNIEQGVRLTVVDTSAEQTGGLYNPIGSVFYIDEGTLTVSKGKFESGPRYSEYYSYNEKIVSSASAFSNRTTVEDTARSVCFIQGSQTTYITAPIINPYTTTVGEVVYTHGNIYFDNDLTRGNLTIRADTYCYYRTSQDESLLTNDPSTSDWRYTYYVTKDYEYYAATLSNGENEDDYYQITIYGYEDVITESMNKQYVEDYYAAIKMKAGSLEILNGEFFSYFGTYKSACVNASGGNISVRKGVFSTRIPDAFTAVEDSVIVKEEDEEAFEETYFTNFDWANTTFTEGAQARRGTGRSIINSGEAVVSIGTGKFYSSNNNIIDMQGGTLTIGGGEFTKRMTLPLGEPYDDGAAIFMQNGNLSVSNATYTVIGDLSTGIYMNNGKIDINNCSCDIFGESAHGIYSTVMGDDNFVVNNTDFTLQDGNNQVGIYSKHGRVVLTSSTQAEIYLSGSDGKGILVEEGGSVESSHYSYEIAGDRSYGIYSTGGSVEASGGTLQLDSNENCYGIYVSSTETSAINVSVEDAEIIVGYNSTNNKTSGTHRASVGVFLATNNSSNAVNLTNTNISSYEIGVAVAGGHLNVYGEGIIETKKASAAAVASGSVTFMEDSSYVITSNATTLNSSSNTYNLTLPLLQKESESSDNYVINDFEYQNTDGIYVMGGSFEALGEIDLTHNGLQNDVSYTNYTGLEMTSFAVRVSNGHVTMQKGSITATQGGGIYCSGGDITMGNELTQQEDITVTTTGETMGGSLDAIGTYISNGWQTYKSVNGGHAVELHGGNIVIYNGTFEASYGNGVAAEGDGEIHIYGGTFNGWMGTGSNALSGKSGPAAFYGLKVIGGANVYIHDGTFDGGNGGAFITGIDEFISKTNISGNMAYVYIYKGSFGHENTNLEDGFNVYDMATVIFGATDYSGQNIQTGNDSPLLDDINIYAKSATIAANKITYNGSYERAYIEIYYGNYVEGSLLYNEGNGASILVYNTNLGHASVPSGNTYTNVNNSTEVFFTAT